MPASTSSGTTTVTGVEPNVSVLEGQTGINVITTASGFKIYESANRILLSGATFTINPEIGKLVFLASVPTNHALTSDSTSTLNLGVKTIINGAARYTRGDAIVFLRQPTGAAGHYAFKDFDNSGQINFYGASINIGCGILFRSTSSGTIEKGRIFHRDVAGLSGAVQDFWYGSSLVVEDLEYEGYTQPVIINAGTTFNGVTAKYFDGLFPSTGFRSGSTTFLEFRNYEAQGTNQDQAFWRRNLLKVINPASDTKGRGSLTPTNNKNTGYKEDVHEFQVVYFETDSVTPIEGAKYFVKDYDNGNRKDSTGLAGGEPNYAVGFDNTADKIYSGVSNATGETPLNTVVCKIQDVTTPNDPQNPAEIYHEDIRSKYNDANNHRFDRYDLKYGYLPNVSEQLLAGKGVKTFTSILVPEAAITELDEATALAYTTQETAQKAYDQLRAIWIRDFDFTITTFPFLLSGNTLTSTIDIDIDFTQTGEAVLTPTKATLFVTPGENFAGSITAASSVVTTIGTGEVVGTIIDTNGTRTVTNLTITGLKTNSEVRIYEAGTTTEIAGIENSGTSFSALIDTSLVDIGILSIESSPVIQLKNIDTSENLTLPVSQRPDRNYSNP